MNQITDPALLEQLNAPTTATPVTDADVLSALDHDDDFSLADMVMNVPESGAKYAKSIYDAVTSPIDTATGIANVAGGYGVKLGQALPDPAAMPDDVREAFNAFNDLLVDMGIGAQSSGVVRNKEAYAEAMSEFVKGRYGNWDRFKRTAEADPVGVLGDVAAVLTAAGGLTRVGLIQKAGAVAEPMTAPIALISGAARTTAKLLPKRAYQSAAKMKTAQNFTLADRSRAIGTALDRQIPPTSGGVEKVTGMIDDVSAAVDFVIDSAPQGKPIPVNAVFQGFKELRQAARQSPADAAKDLRMIDRYAKDFMQWHKSQGKQAYTAAELNAFKRSQYRKVGPKGYSRAPGGKEAPLMETTRKTAASGAREAIESRVPEVKALNQELSDLLHLRDAIAPSAKRIDNANLIGLDDAAKVGAATAAGYAATGGSQAGGIAGTTVGVLATILGNPHIKSRIAFQMHKLAKKGMLDDYLTTNFSPEVAQILKSAVGPGGRVVYAQSSQAAQPGIEDE